MSVERKPDWRFAWSLRTGRAALVDDGLVSASHVVDSIRRADLVARG